MRWLTLIFLILPNMLTAQPPARPLQLNHIIAWSFDHDGARPLRYRAGPMTLTLQGARHGDSARLAVTVAQAGMAPATLRSDEVITGIDQHVSVGRWDAQRQYVMFQNFSGGAHCCNQISLVVPEGGRLRIVDLGQWDGDYQSQPARDRDGDGRLDFVFIDNAFLYAFASYAESLAPPQIMNVVDGRAVDVSARPGFRPLFAAAERAYRPRCLQHGPEDNQNGACAAYVAAAARTGHFDAAWAELLRSYKRDVDWDLPTGCRVDDSHRACPDADIIHYRDYPEALRHFLVDHHYIAR